MKGFVQTPTGLVDRMVYRLFEDRVPRVSEIVLDAGCGRGEFIAGVLRWCARRGTEPPTIVGVKNDPRHYRVARARFADDGHVKILGRDCLEHDPQQYDFILSNPPGPKFDTDSASVTVSRSGRGNPRIVRTTPVSRVGPTLPGTAGPRCRAC